MLLFRCVGASLTMRSALGLTRKTPRWWRILDFEFGLGWNKEGRRRIWSRIDFGDRDHFGWWRITRRRSGVLDPCLGYFEWRLSLVDDVFRTQTKLVERDKGHGRSEAWGRSCILGVVLDDFQVFNL